MAEIHYKTQFSCNASRTLQVYVRNNKYSLDAIEGSNQTQKLKQLYESNSQDQKIFKLVNRQPQWNEKLSCFVLDFKGRSKLASVKNMILVNEADNKESLVFCKTEEN